MRTWLKRGENRCSIRRARAVPCFWPEDVARRCSCCRSMAFAQTTPDQTNPDPQPPPAQQPHRARASPTRRKNARPRVTRSLLLASAGAFRIRSQIKRNERERRSKPSRPRKSASFPTSRSPNRSLDFPASRRSALRGRAEIVSIRGFSPDFTTVLLNGRQQASSGFNRAVEFDQYPSELMGSVVVYKTPDASIVGHGPCRHGRPSDHSAARIWQARDRAEPARTAMTRAAAATTTFRNMAGGEAPATSTRMRAARSAG